MAQTPCSLFPLADSPCSLFYSPFTSFVHSSTYLAPSNCDRNVHSGPRLLMTDPSWPTPSLYTHPFPIYPPLPSKFPEPQLPSALQSRPQEYSGSWCPEQFCPSWLVLVMMFWPTCPVCLSCFPLLWQHLAVLQSNIHLSSCLKFAYLLSSILPSSFCAWQKKVWAC
jgi:hypothetical protein